MRSIIAFFVLCSLATAQESAIVEFVTGGDFKPYGRGVLVQKDAEKHESGSGSMGIVLTAYHVVDDLATKSPAPLVRYSNGKRTKGVYVLKSWPENDVALVKVWAPDGIEPVDVTDQHDAEENIWTVNKEWNRKERIGLRIRSKVTNFFDHSPRHGESGGPIFQGKRVLSIVSGGFVLNEEEKTIWPMQAGRIDVAVKELEAIKKR